MVQLKSHLEPVFQVLEQELCTCIFTFINKKNISRVKCKSEFVVNRKRLSRMLISVGERLRNNQNLQPESGLGKSMISSMFLNSLNCSGNQSRFLFGCLNSVINPRKTITTQMQHLLKQKRGEISS